MGFHEPPPKSPNGRNPPTELLLLLPRGERDVDTTGGASDSVSVETAPKRKNLPSKPALAAGVKSDALLVFRCVVVLSFSGAFAAAAFFLAIAAALDLASAAAAAFFLPAAATSALAAALAAAASSRFCLAAAADFALTAAALAALAFAAFTASARAAAAAAARDAGAGEGATGLDLGAKGASFLSALAKGFVSAPNGLLLTLAALLGFFSVALPLVGAARGALLRGIGICGRVGVDALRGGGLLSLVLRASTSEGVEDRARFGGGETPI